MKQRLLHSAAASALLFFMLCVSFVSAQPVRKVLIEEFTTASCGNCPMMSQYIRTWHEANAANSILMCIHEGSGVDAMSNANTAAVFNAMHPATTWFAPAAMIERAIYPSTAGEAYLSCYQSWGSPGGPGIDTIAVRLMNEPPVVGLEISGTYNSTTRTLDATVSATFLQPIPAGDWRINLFLVEDSVVGWPGLGPFTGWDQHCYNSSWANTWYPGMFDGTSIIGYPHRHVMRNSLLGNWGAAGVIPSLPVTGSTYTTTGSLVLDTAYHDDKLSLVAFVSSYGTTKADKFILNANDIKVNNNFSTGIEAAIPAGFSAHLYPVPATDKVHLVYSGKNPGNVQVLVTDLAGRLLKSIARNDAPGVHEIIFSAAEFSKGIYFVTVTSIEGRSVNRFVVE
jgi:hypothetical protein